MKKIIRKKISKVAKYSDIGKENYNKIITDLIGVRVIHLFKYEWENIHNNLLELWNKKEKPVAYIRSGDEKELTKNYSEKGCRVEVHPDAYRSIHYIISSEATKKKILAEIQVRTIFEEGWSEIDHRIRYPDFTDNPNICQFLKIFNRLAGSADEMGTFINLLTNSIKIQDEFNELRKKEKDELEAKIDGLLVDLDKKDDSGRKHKETINKLKNEIQNLRTSSISISKNPSLAEYAATFFSSTPKMEELYKNLNSDLSANMVKMAAGLDSEFSSEKLKLMRAIGAIGD